MSSRLADVFYYGLDGERNIELASLLYHEAEVNLIIQMKMGDPFCNKLLEHIIKCQDEIRQEMLAGVQ